MRSCEAAREFEGIRFLSSEAPMLPLDRCTQSTCQCRYVHHDDRRSQRDRRVQFPNPHAVRNGERRQGTGRRITD
jgi:hypothetical protein